MDLNSEFVKWLEEKTLVLGTKLGPMKVTKEFETEMHKYSKLFCLEVEHASETKEVGEEDTGLDDIYEGPGDEYVLFRLELTIVDMTSYFPSRRSGKTLTRKKWYSVRSIWLSKKLAPNS